MQVRIKRLNPAAELPSKAHEWDAGFDLKAVSMTVTQDYMEYGTGLAFEIPEGHVGLLFPRSSISKKELLLANSVGVLDAPYRGEVTFRFKYNHTPDLEKYYRVGDRIGQLLIIPIPQIEFVFADDLSDTARGTGGYGSTGQ